MFCAKVEDAEVYLAGSYRLMYLLIISLGAHTNPYEMK